VLIPGLRFNRKRDKLFFYIAPEGMDQPMFSGAQTFVPTAQMLQGNFSPQYIATLGTAFANAYPYYAALPTSTEPLPSIPAESPESLLNPTSLAYTNSFPR